MTINLVCENHLPTLFPTTYEFAYDNQVVGSTKVADSVLRRLGTHPTHKLFVDGRCTGCDCREFGRVSHFECADWNYEFGNREVRFDDRSFDITDPFTNQETDEIVTSTETSQYVINSQIAAAVTAGRIQAVRNQRAANRRTKGLTAYISEGPANATWTVAA